MINTIEKHRMLRLDLVDKMNINKDAIKTYYFYNNCSNWPDGFMFADLKSQFLFVKDYSKKIIYFYDDFYQRVKLMYSCLELNTDDCYVMNDIVSFFKTNKSIKIAPSDTPFNPYQFAGDYKFQVIEKPFEINLIEASIQNLYEFENDIKKKNNSSNPPIE